MNPYQAPQARVDQPEKTARLRTLLTVLLIISAVVGALGLAVFLGLIATAFVTPTAGPG